MKYRIKLYGHMADDPERFRRELAEVLRIDLDDAERLILNVPVVVRQDMARSAADRFAADLKSIQALCLVESEGAEQEPEAPAGIVTAALTSHDTAEDDRTGLRIGRIGLMGFAAALGVIVIVGTVAFWGVFKKTYHSNRTEPDNLRPATLQETGQQETQPSAAQLQERINKLEDRIKHVQDLMRLKKDEVESAMYSSRTDFEATRQSRVDLEELREELRSHHREITRLKAELAKMAASSTGAFR